MITGIRLQIGCESDECPPLAAFVSFELAGLRRLEVATRAEVPVSRLSFLLAKGGLVCWVFRLRELAPIPIKGLPAVCFLPGGRPGFLLVVLGLRSWSGTGCGGPSRSVAGIRSVLSDSLTVGASIAWVAIVASAS